MKNQTIIVLTRVAYLGYPPPHFLLFSIVNEIYDYYEALSTIILFQMNESFSQHFRGFKLEYSIHATYAIQFVSLIFLTSTSRSL